MNKGKCEYLSCGDAGPVRFAGGQRVERNQEAKYLGCVLKERADPGKESAHRITECMIILQRMRIFWRQWYLSHTSNYIPGL